MSQSTQTVYDLIISGAGIPGASLALGAADLGLRVALIDRRAGLAQTGDTRTTALLPESLEFLDSLGLWQQIREQAQSLTQMRLIDDRDHKRDQAEILTFENPQGPLAYNIVNQILAAEQETALKARSRLNQIDLYWQDSVSGLEINGDGVVAVLEQGAHLSARLCVAADGRQSTIRENLKLGWQSFSDHQTALTARFHHQQPHKSISTEFHRHAGPMTFVPLAGESGNMSALVWCVSNAQAKTLLALDDQAFLGRVQIASRGILGQFSHVIARSAFPVRPGFASALSKGPVVLMAEAAHVLPPLLAQGLNLSLTDVKVLLESLFKYGPSVEAAQDYANHRWADILARLGFSEGINQILSRAPASISGFYDMGRLGLQTIPGLRQAAVRIGHRGRQVIP